MLKRLCLPLVALIALGGCAHGELSGLESDDHEQYLLADGSRSLTGDISIGGNRVTNVASATEDTDAVPRGDLDAAVASHVAGDEHLTYLSRDGSRPMLGDLDAGANRVANVRNARPDSQDAMPLSQAQRAFVRLDANAPGTYHTVAGGRFRVDGTPIGATYNGLQVRPRGNVGNMFLFEASFNSYRNPDDPGATHALIVKATAESRTGETFASVVAFDANSMFISVGPRDREPSGFMLEIGMIPAQ